MEKNTDSEMDTWGDRTLLGLGIRTQPKLYPGLSVSTLNFRFPGNILQSVSYT